MPPPSDRAPDRPWLAARRAALSGVEGARLFPYLVALARGFGASIADAEDAAQTAMTKFWSGERAWDEKVEPDVKRHLAWIVRSEVSHAKQSAQRRLEKPSDAIDDVAPVALAAPPSGADAAGRDARREEALRELRVALAADPRGLQIVDLIQDGIGKPAEQAATLRVPVGQVYDAIDRIQRHVKRIAAARAAASEDEVDE